MNRAQKRRIGRAVRRAHRNECPAYYGIADQRLMEYVREFDVAFAAVIRALNTPVNRRRKHPRPIIHNGKAHR